MEAFTKIILVFLQYSLWPIAVITVALILKKPLKNLKILKYKDWQIEMNNEANPPSGDVK